jgi:hypothetical protein
MSCQAGSSVRKKGAKNIFWHGEMNNWFKIPNNTTHSRMLFCGLVIITCWSYILCQSGSSKLGKEPASQHVQKINRWTTGT